MKLTPEQEAIIGSEGDITINAVAGSGKTTTLIAYARTRPAGSRILYLAFNKTVQREAEQRFAEQGLSYVTVKTAHSLAYQYVVRANGYQVRPQDFKTYELVELLGLQRSGEKHAEYVLANHIRRFATYFCNSNRQTVASLDYLETIADEKALEFVKRFYDFIEHKTRLLLAIMNRGEIAVTHDFYLKKFQLAKPTLPYDYILFDEGQDASPAMLDVFLNQPATKVIVGDTHQQIYGWRYAVNSLEKTNFTQYPLSSSFRFNADIADLARQVLLWKSYLQPAFLPPPIYGRAAPAQGKSQTPKAIIGRTNLGLLLKSIRYVYDRKLQQGIYFEGNFSSYVYADEGASLYDVLRLSQGQHALIRDKLIRAMDSLEDLEEYIDKTEDAQLRIMVEIVREHGSEIPKIMNYLKEKQLPEEQKNEAAFIFSTVHRCKGMEYDVVQLVDDFLDEEQLAKAAPAIKDDMQVVNKLKEEVNLLYVAVTRTKKQLHIPEELLPIAYDTAQKSSTILVVKKKQSASNTSSKGKNNDTKAYNLDEKRQTHKAAYRPWTDTLDEELRQAYDQGLDIKTLAQSMGRTAGAIQSRLRKLGLISN
ncbi:UvrD-helicase domain-containing protein [Eisenibacter elegans]|uniref:UvrD-helicase domain-containing protein n=1 Tax=Eisenibacter elegans TaxID=997 RepID=UPI000417A341|nr:UvrD-helicase domain-containing protein [Eisenibacter elegans]